jgi:F0F1-type ATP synthase membrane subunit b/b'
MAETNENENLTNQQEPVTPPAAEPQKPDTQEQMIPKERFDEVNRKYKDADKAREAAEKALKEAQEVRLKEKEDYKALYEQTTSELSELKPKAEQFDSYQETMSKLLEAQIEEIPEELRSLIPDELSVKQKIDWIAKNKKLLLKPVGPDIGAGVHGSGGGGGTVKLTPEEQQAAHAFGYTDEEYAKYKEVA